MKRPIKRLWFWKPRILCVLFANVVLITSVGCQTCSLSEADFQKQQSGQTVDHETGEVVAVVGTLGYYGFVIGEIIAAAFGK